MARIAGYQFESVFARSKSNVTRVMDDGTVEPVSEMSSAQFGSHGYSWGYAGTGPAALRSRLEYDLYGPEGLKHPEKDRLLALIATLPQEGKAELSIEDIEQAVGRPSQRDKLPASFDPGHKFKRESELFDALRDAGINVGPATDHEGLFLISGLPIDGDSSKQILYQRKADGSLVLYGLAEEGREEWNPDTQTYQRQSIAERVQKVASEGAQHERRHDADLSHADVERGMPGYFIGSSLGQTIGHVDAHQPRMVPSGEEFGSWHDMPNARRLERERYEGLGLVPAMKTAQAAIELPPSDGVDRTSLGEAALEVGDGAPTLGALLRQRVDAENAARPQLAKRDRPAPPIDSTKDRDDHDQSYRGW